MRMSEVKRKIYKENDLYQARLEDVNGTIFIHITMKKMNTKAIRELLDQFDGFKTNIKKAGYKFLHTYSATPKFYQMFKGYEEVGDMVWEDKEYKVLRWELK